MNKLFIKALGGLIFLIVALGIGLFLPAGTINFWQAWIYIFLFFISTAFITIYLMNKDTALLERRVKAGSAAEKEKSQKKIQFIAQIAFIAIILIPAFDHRYMLSSVPVLFVLIGDLFVVIGFYIVFLVFKENTFTSAIIDVDKQQKVISTGPYAFIRHPMYLGALIMLLGTPLALGSWWGFTAFILMFCVITLRLLDEERLLTKNLKGYINYCNKVKFRLIPFVW